MENEDLQSYQRPYIIGNTRGKKKKMHISISYPIRHSHPMHLRVSVGLSDHQRTTIDPDWN